MVLFASIIGYIAVAVGFYVVMAKAAPVQEDESFVRPLLFVVDGTIQTDERKSA